MDLHSTMYPNHMSPSAQSYLGLMTPFCGLHVLAHSEQGLLGQSEELDKLMSKILKDQLKEGIVAKKQDYLVIGGVDQHRCPFTMLR